MIAEIILLGCLNLRSWGADQEDDKNRAEDEAYRLHGQVSDLERRVAELEADVYRPLI